MNVFDLYAKISLDSSDYEKGLKNAGEQMGGFASKLKGGLAVAAKVGGAAIAAAAAGFAALTKSAISNYAEYEQLAGGAQKIFDQMDYSDIARDASNAYKELGLSANQYLAVINDVGATFAATMGDAAGYEAAKTGLKAISDYASGTGKNVNELSQKFTLITRSTSSYQSIADQFSGILPATSAAFLEQAQAAGVLSDSYSQLSEVPIAEYQEAISQMLEQGVADLGLANNTANEAFSTLSGSLSMLKAAWENFLTGMADPSSDFDALINNLVDSVETVAEQLVPRILATVPRLLEGISALVESLSQKLPGLIGDVLNTVMEELPKIATMLSDMLIELVDVIGQNGGTIVDAALKLINNLIVGLTKLAPKLLKTVSQLAVDIVTSFAENLPGIIQAASDFLVAFVEGLMDSLDIITDSLPTIIEAVVDGLDKSIPILIDAVIAIVETVLEALPEILPKLVDAVSMLLTKLSEMITNRQDDFVRLFESIANVLAGTMPQLVTALTPAITALVETLATVISTLTPLIGTVGVKLLTAIFSAFSENAGAYTEALGSLVSGLITVIGQNAQMMLNLGTELLLAIGDAIMQCAQDGTLDEAGEALISGMWDAAISVATSLGKALFGAIISGFGMESKMNTPENFAKQQQELFGITPAPQNIPLPEGIPVIGGGGFGGGLTINQTINGTNMTAAQAFREAKTAQLAAQWMTGGF